MKIVALAFVAACAACGASPLTTPAPQGADAHLSDQPADAGARAWPDPDCTMFNPVACRLDLAKTSVAIDVNYPNVVICRLQILPTSNLLNTGAYAQLASAWQVTMGGPASDQTVLAPETPQAVLEYPLGTQQLYLTRVTFTSQSTDTVATLIARALGPDVSLYAIPLACPGQRP